MAGQDDDRVKAHDEYEAKRINEALEIFFPDLSRFADIADAMTEAARAWERVIEALDIHNSDDDPAQRINEMVEYIGDMRASLDAKDAEIARLRVQLMTGL